LTKNNFGALEKGAFILQIKQIQKIFSKILLIENKKTCFVEVQVKNS